MTLVSTRDVNKESKSYTDVLLAGLAPDGGLYVPQIYPQVSQEVLRALKDVPYSEVSYAIKKKLVEGTIDDDTLRTMVTDAYSETSFTDSIDGNITPVSKVQDGLYLQNLSLGPTAAFKDMAMQLLGREMNYELRKQKTHLRILGATSGDTGSAAEAAMKGLDCITLFMLSPEVGMSQFQKAQMGMFSGGNIFNISIKGRFDDCQDMVKEIKGDAEFADLGAVNSINWGRISSQIPYYFSGYLQVAKNIGDPVDFVVPSGNFGNMLAGYIAREMGLPIRRLIVATNENDVLHTLFTTGVYEVTPSQVTSSPSMDISKASNYERLVYDLLGRDAEKVIKYMQDFASNGRVDLADFGVRADIFTQKGFYSGTSNHAQRLTAIKKVYEASGIVIDPHTADGVTVAYEYLDSVEGVPMISMMTALAVKFEDTIKEALGIIPKRPQRFEGIEKFISEDNFTTMEADSSVLKEFIRANSFSGV
jgi:threonine synthase